MKLIVNIPNTNFPTTIAVSDRYDMTSNLSKWEYLQDPSTDSKFRFFYTDGLILIDVQSKLSEVITSRLFFEEDVIAVVFHQEGSCRMVLTGEKGNKEMKLDPAGHTIGLVSSRELDLIFEAEQFVNSFIVLLSSEFCLRVMPGERDPFPDLFRAVTPLSQEMKRIIENVRNCSRKGSFHRLCLEIKIAELLMLQLEQQQLLKAEGIEKPILHEADMGKLEQAKKILDENFIHPPTIKNLALTIGMNETKLKADFKKFYDSTIHAYTQKLRMQKAYQLVTQQNLLLKEVALMVGYQKPSNFTAVFKEFFGIHPKDIA